MSRGKSVIVRSADAEKALLVLEQKQDIVMTAPEFIRLNFQRLKATGLSRRAVYENLKLSGLELGSFEAFSKCWSRNEAINASPSLKPQEEVMQREKSERNGEQEREVKQEGRRQGTTSKRMT